MQRNACTNTLQAQFCQESAQPTIPIKGKDIIAEYFEPYYTEFN